MSKGQSTDVEIWKCSHAFIPLSTSCRGPLLFTVKWKCANVKYEMTLLLGKVMNSLLQALQTSHKAVTCIIKAHMKCRELWSGKKLNLRGKYSIENKCCLFFGFSFVSAFFSCTETFKHSIGSNSCGNSRPLLLSLDCSEWTSAGNYRAQFVLSFYTFCFWYMWLLTRPCRMETESSSLPQPTFVNRVVHGRWDGSSLSFSARGVVHLGTGRHGVILNTTALTSSVRLSGFSLWVWRFWLVSVDLCENYKE